MKIGTSKNIFFIISFFIVTSNLFAVVKEAKDPFKDINKYKRDTQKSIDESKKQESFIKEKMEEASDEEKQSSEELLRDAQDRTSSLEKELKNYSEEFKKFQENSKREKDKKLSAKEQSDARTLKEEAIKKGLGNRANIDEFKKEIKKYTTALSVLLEPAEEPSVDVATRKDSKAFDKILTKPILGKEKRIAELENIAAKMLLKAARVVAPVDPKINDMAIEMSVVDKLRKGKTELSESALSAALAPSVGQGDYGLVDSLSENYKKVVDAIKGLGKKTTLPAELTAESLENFSKQSEAKFQEGQVDVPG